LTHGANSLELVSVGETENAVTLLKQIGAQPK
jgi:hypothetical protein